MAIVRIRWSQTAAELIDEDKCFVVFYEWPKNMCVQSSELVVLAVGGGVVGCFADVFVAVAHFSEMS